MTRRFSPLKERMRTCEAVRGMVRSGWKGSPRELTAELSRPGFVLPSRETVRRWSLGLSSPFTNVLQADLRPSGHLSFYYGAWAGDGWEDTNDGGARMRLKVRSGSFAEEFAESANHVLKRRKPCRVWKTCDASGDWYNVKVTSVELLEFVRRPFADIAGDISKFPREFLRGFYTAEGNPSVNVQRSRGIRLDAGIVVSNCDSGLLAFARGLLLELGYAPAGIRTDKEAGFITNLAKATMALKQFTISRQTDVARFAREIGFADREKQNKLDDAVRLVSSEARAAAALKWQGTYAKSGRKWVKRSS